MEIFIFLLQSQRGEWGVRALILFIFIQIFGTGQNW